MKNWSFIDRIDNSGAKLLAQILKILRNNKDAKLASQVIIAIEKRLYRNWFEVSFFQVNVLPTIGYRKKPGKITRR